MTESFRPQYLTDLPTPLAHFYHRSYGNDLRARHENLTYLFEAIVKLAVIPAAMEYVGRIKQSSAERDSRVDKELSALGRPMLGQWVGMLRELARYFEQKAGSAPQTLTQLASQLNCKRRDQQGALNLYARIKNGVDDQRGRDTSCSLLQLINALVAYRNCVKGHGTGDRPSVFYEEIVPLLFDGMNQLLADVTLSIFANDNSGLVLVREIRQLDGEQREVEMLPLVGLVPIEKTVTRTVTSIEAAGLQRNSVGFLWPESAPLSLSPLLIWKEVDNQAKPLVFNGGTRKPKYACFDTGTNVDDSSMTTAIADLLATFEQARATPTRNTITLDHSLLPYMVNREPQERRIQRVLEQEMDARRPRAVVFILSGDAAQCHDKFKNRLVQFTLCKLYGLGSDDRVDDAFVRFPVDEHEKDEFQDELHWLLSDKFADESRDLGELARRLTERAILIYSELNTSDWNAHRERQMDWFLRFWQQMPEVWRKPPPVICLGLKYVSGLGFWDRRRHARRNERAKKWLSQVSSDAYPDIRLEIMPELPNVKRGDVDNWRLKFERELNRFPNAHLMESELDRLFEQSHEFPMQQLAPALRDLLERRNAA